MERTHTPERTGVAGRGLGCAPLILTVRGKLAPGRTVGVQTYLLPINYEPARRYTEAQWAVLLQEQGALLCWFAAQSGYEPCALGVDFEGYDAAAGLAPVQVIPADYTRHGHKTRF